MHLVVPEPAIYRQYDHVYEITTQYMTSQPDGTTDRLGSFSYDSIATVVITVYHVCSCEEQLKQRLPGEEKGRL